jgi:tRNA-splicing ligase RtcB
MSWAGSLEKITDYKWRIPKNYKPGMRVDGIIYADEKLLVNIKKDNAPEQVANVAFLPGIVKYSLAMPDIHWGYGFCLPKGTKILTEFGFYKSIEEFEDDWFRQNLKSMDLKLKKPIYSSILRFMKLKSSELVKIITKTGYEIYATADHPFLTPSGMKEAGKLQQKDKLAIYPFKGVKYEKSPSEVIISERKIREVLVKHKRYPDLYSHKVIIKKLKERNLLPLTYDHPKIGYILKIMGFLFGDGSMNFIGKRKEGILHFSGKPEDLERVREDIEKIGYTASPLYHSKRKLSKEKKYDCYSFYVNASSFVFLLEALGVPLGSKVDKSYRVPSWIFKAPSWQKRLFLASLFGCELRTPHRRVKRRGYFNAPVFPMAKREELVENGKEFLKDIAKLLNEFGVNILYILQRRKHINKKGKVSWALELIISPLPQNLYNLWARIGFEYNAERSFMANVAAHYLKYKLNILKEKQEVIEKIQEFLNKGLSYRRIAEELAWGNPITKRFVVDVCWKLNKGKKISPRIPSFFPDFKEYIKDITSGLEKSGMVWDEIAKIERVKHDDYVYDFTVSCSDHNFIANNFVVSNCIGGVAATDPENGGVISPGGVGFDINCGVRLLKTNLTLEDVEDKVSKIVNTLYQDVPSGVGSKGEIRISAQEERRLLVKGAKWAVEKGLGTKEDLEKCEEFGAIDGADPDCVSERAYERGRQQAGTLGSGNHFLEMQVIEEIFDREIAERLGLFIGQIVVMIHSGSRGFGYQVCDDYVRIMVRCLSKYGINVPDKQLACAPIDSKEAKDYIGAMKAAANYAWCNRQVLMHLVRLSFEKVFSKSWQSLGMDLIYDVAHNIAKFEKHSINGESRLLCVHRKGATRAFGPGNPQLPACYRDIGQPVIIPGDMGTASYLLVGTKKAEEESFASTCHGAGRVKSRHEAIRTVNFENLIKELKSKGIEVRATGKKTIVEEAPSAYKDVDQVIEVVHKAGLSKKVCKMKPLCVVKG